MANQAIHAQIVAIVEVDSSVFIVPEKLLVTAGQLVIFQNLTGQDVKITFHNQLLFGVPDQTLGTGTDEALRVKDVTPGAYSYKVDKAAAAMPIIIVHDPIT